MVGLWIKLNGWQSFIYGFIGAALIWGIYATILNSGNGGILASRVGNLFGGMNGITLILVTAIVSGIMGGLGAMTGSLGRQLFEK